MGGAEGMASGGTLSPTRPPSLHLWPRPPSFPLSVLLAASQHTRWVSEICAPSSLHGRRPQPPPTPAFAPPHGTNHKLSVTAPAPARRPGSRRAQSFTSFPPAPRPPRPHPRPSSAARGRARGSPRGTPPPAPPAPSAGSSPPRRARPARRLPGSRHRSRPPSCCVLQTEQRAKALLPGTFCQRRSDRVAGAECATGQNGGWLVFGGGNFRLISLGGRAVCGAGAGQML